MANRAETNIESLRERVSLLPKEPGVYIMKNAKGEVIYVGKAKALRERVLTYINGGDGRYQIAYLLRQVSSIDSIVTMNEDQALVLESDLIKKYKPRYNIRLKDDRAYFSVRIDRGQEWPRLELVRRVEDDGAHYFGPYPSGNELRTMLEVIRSVIPLRTCSDTVFHNRQRPCLEYEIKRCAGPCCLPVERLDYERWLKRAESLLQGRTKQVAEELTREMEQASEDLRFEEAAALRDKIEFLESFASGKQVISFKGENRDVFVLYREESLAAVAVLMVRGGRISGSTSFTFNDVQVPDQEILSATITQFYESGREVPEELLTNVTIEDSAVIERYLSERAESKVELLVPERGLKARLVSLAELNARQAFTESFDAEERNSRLLQELAKLLSLKQVPRRIECVDISNFQGKDIVASLVSFYDGLPDKKSYKRYRVSFEGEPNDFAAINEVVLRRLKRVQREESAPDLLLIDGGPGQLSSALKARDELGLELEIASLAKSRLVDGQMVHDEAPLYGSAGKTRTPERLFREGCAESIPLDESRAVTHLLQRIRDEAHRFAITFHRERRSKSSFGSVLDKISGLGPERKARLMKSFGSVATLSKASAEEIAKAGRMPLALARKILAAISLAG